MRPARVGDLDDLSVGVDDVLDDLVPGAGLLEQDAVHFLHTLQVERGSWERAVLRERNIFPSSRPIRVVSGGLYHELLRQLLVVRDIRRVFGDGRTVFVEGGGHGARHVLF